MYFQNTIKRRIELKGVGIHSGERVKAYLEPAPADTGIVFRHYRQNDFLDINASYDNLLRVKNAITVGTDDFSIQTIEHFMAAFYAYDITNIVVLVDGQELPILDGSAKVIVDSIEEAGIQVQNAFYEPFYIPYPIWVEKEGKILIALPNEGFTDDFRIIYTIDFSSKSNVLHNPQMVDFSNITKDIFKKSIAPARTFGFLEDVEDLNSHNLALGGSLDNALIFTKKKLLNNELRFEDECVRHKALDLIGDLSLVGHKLKGQFMAFKAGHSMHMELVKKITRIIGRKKRAQDFSLSLRRRKQNEFERFLEKRSSIKNSLIR
jgi:UDP-3-O-[3-hydroxymyristoyl] N-acetylglucosamine deacetylase